MQTETQSNAVDKVLLQQIDTLYAFSFLLCRDTKHASILTRDAIIEARRTHDRRDAGLGLEHHVLQQLWEMYQPPTESTWTPAAAPIEHTLLGKNKFEAAFHEAVSGLKSQAGIVVFLCDSALLTPLEAGFVLKMPISTVRSRLYRARATLRKNLNDFEKDKLTTEAETLADPTKFKACLRFIMKQHQVEIPQKLQQELQQILLPRPQKKALNMQSDGTSDANPNKWYWPLTIFIIFSLSSLAYLLTPAQEPVKPLGNDLMTRSAAALLNVKMVLPDNNIARLEEFIYTYYRIHATPPIINDAVLIGLGSTEIMPEVVVPVFIYTEPNGDSLVVYIYNYRLLDRFRNFIAMDATLQMRLIDDHHYEMIASGYEDYYAVTWRRRATIFVAITKQMPEALLERVAE